MNYIIYTDGACHVLTNKQGGYFFVLIDLDKQKYREYSNIDYNTTNNRMELKAVISALEHTEENSNIKIYTDSKYVSNPYNENWIIAWRKDKFNRLNSDLWKKLDNLVLKRNVKFIWIKGHNKDDLNERANLLAVNASNKELIDKDWTDL